MMMNNIYYESVILEQQIKYFILENNYESICEAEQKKSILERIKDFLGARIEKVLSILKAIKEFIVKLFTKIIPSTYKYIKMHLKDKLKNKNKEYTTIDIYAIKENIRFLTRIGINIEYNICPDYKLEVLDYMLSNSKYDEFIENLKDSNIGKYEDNTYISKHTKKISNLEQIKISYNEILKAYTGTPNMKYSSKMIDNALKEIDRLQSRSDEKVLNFKNTYDVDEKILQKRIQEFTSIFNKNLSDVLKFLDAYKNELASNVTAYNNYFKKYLTELDREEKDQFANSTRKSAESMFEKGD